MLHSSAAAPNGPHGRIRPLVLSCLALGTLAWLADGTTGLVVVLAMTALVVTALLRVPARPAPHAPAPVGSWADDTEADDVTERLRRMYDDHVEQVNMAVAEDRDDLVQELSDGYMDQALRLITAGERPLSVG